MTDLNPRPADYKSAALPTELKQRIIRFERLNNIPQRRCNVNNYFQKIKLFQIIFEMCTSFSHKFYLFITNTTGITDIIS